MSRKPIRNRILTGLGVFLMATTRWLPWSVGYLFGGLIGRLTYMLSKRERQKAHSSIAIAFDGELDADQQKQLAIESFRNMGRILFEFTKLPGLANRRILRRVKVSGLELLEQARRAEKGIVIATGHIGNWEIMGCAAVQLGFPLHVIAREIHISGFNKLVIDLREKAGINTIVRNSEGSARQILSALRRKQMLAMLIDQDINAEGQFVDFFGAPALTPTGAARLAIKTGAELVAACCHRTGIGSFEIKLSTVAFDLEAGEDEAVLQATQQATRILEGWIREYPGQWPWIHQRWKTQP